MAEVKDENGRKERFFLFYDGESVTGKVKYLDNKFILKTALTFR